jgi:NitT/TauT family transport system permease protein
MEWLMSSAALARPVAEPRRAALLPALKNIGLSLLVLLVTCVLWEAYKWIGERLELTHPFPVNGRTMPHVYDMVGQLFEPSRRNGPLLIDVLLDAALFTAKEAAAGFLLGAAIGFAIAVVLSESRLLQRGFLPYLVASQTIPILAIAPMVVIWVNPKLPESLAGWGAVSVIAAYLTFFPVTINTLRGLQSADPRAVELMRSYAANRWEILRKLRIPASFPFLFTALKIAAPAAVVGAIIGELPSSIQDGLAGAILNFNQYYITSPESLWATNIIAAALGILFFLVVALAERLLVRRAPENIA